MKRTIKTLCITLISGFILVAIHACDDFLTEELKGSFSSETFYQNDKQALQALNGAYSAIAFTTFHNAMWVFGDVASDDAVKGGNPGDQSEITYIDEFTADANNGILSDYWSFAYEGIARANNVLANVPGVEMDETLKNRILGEALFIRAYTYFNLVNLFGRVPLKLQPQLTFEAIHVPLSDISAIYQQIEEDLTEAATLLPVSYGAADQGRMTRGAALGMLAKSSLYQEKWNDVITYSHQMEALSQYSLMPVYPDLFRLQHENNQESIVEIQHLSGQNPFTGSALNQWFAPAQEGGYYFNAPTESLVAAFEKLETGEVDPRLNATVGREGYPWLNGETFSATWSPTGYLTRKHQQPLSEIPSSLKGDGDLNYIYLRYADILLMKAEAFNEINNPDSAKANLNRVRQRARESFEGVAPEGLLSPVTTSDAAQLRIAIRQERRVELAQEFHRYFDLMRWGKAVAESALGADFHYDTDRYLPLPQTEIDANQGIN